MERVKADMKILVSACLIGENCKYNGKNNYNPRVAQYLAGKEYLAVCPETLGGLGVPRNPAELVNGRAIDDHGNDVDERFRAGVAEALRRIEGEDIELAILQSRSPTCGVRQIYDGSFSKRLIDGQGMLAAALKERGIRLVDAEEV